MEATVVMMVAMMAAMMAATTAAQLLLTMPSVVETAGLVLPSVPLDLPAPRSMTGTPSVCKEMPRATNLTEVMDHEMQFQKVEAAGSGHVRQSRRREAVVVVGIAMLLLLTMCICLVLGIVHIFLPLLSTYSYFIHSS
jgi:hypothetical protein